MAAVHVIEAGRNRLGESWAGESKSVPFKSTAPQVPAIEREFRIGAKNQRGTDMHHPRECWQGERHLWPRYCPPQAPHELCVTHRIRTAGYVDARHAAISKAAQIAG